MTLLSEEKRQELLKAWIRAPHVNETCIWCSACVAISGEVFDLNDDCKAYVKELDNYDALWVDDSIMACPVTAISWIEE